MKAVQFTQDPTTAPKSKVLKILVTILLTLIAILYTVGMRAFGAAFSGGGRGSRFFLFLVAGPEGLLLLVWPTLAALLPWTRSPKPAVAALMLSLIPLAWVGIVLNIEGLQDDVIRNIWRSARGVVYVFSVFYLLPSLIGLLAGFKGTILTLKDLRKKPADAK